MSKDRVFETYVARIVFSPSNPLENLTFQNYRLRHTDIRSAPICCFWPRCPATAHYIPILAIPSSSANSMNFVLQYEHGYAFNSLILMQMTWPIHRLGNCSLCAPRAILSLVLREMVGLQYLCICSSVFYPMLKREAWRDMVCRDKRK